IVASPRTYFNLFGVRFVIDMPGAFSARTARERNFHKVGFGYWVGEYALHPRSFVVGRAVRVGSIAEGLARVAAPGFDVRQEAVIRGGGLPAVVEGGEAQAEGERSAGERVSERACRLGLQRVGARRVTWRAA